MIKVAVIAGTPVDTKMGVEYIEAQNKKAGKVIAEPLYRPVAENCDDQVRFQYSDYENKRRTLDGIFDPAIEQGVKDFFIYCNSLSGAFDFDEYAVQKGVHIFTPLQVYRNLGKQFRRVGVVCANNLSAYNIEKNLLMTNDDLYVIGTGNMAIVSAIEEGLSPDEIVDLCGLKYMIRYMESCRCEALILGCTHFPYVVEELKKECSMPIIDPADEMFRAMTGE